MDSPKAMNKGTRIDLSAEWVWLAVLEKFINTVLNYEPLVNAWSTRGGECCLESTPGSMQYR